MQKMKKLIILLSFLVIIVEFITAQEKHKFEFAGNDFLLDGKPFQIIGGEMHPARIPHEYWRHRIRMAKAMGHINFAQEMIDRKGITERASLNGMTLMNWEVFNLPFNDKYIQSLTASVVDTAKRLIFFKGRFNLNQTGDCWFDLSEYQKGIVFINGHNLGRYWNIGPQTRLYCPASWLKEATNEILIFDLLQTQAKEIRAFAYSENEK
jgi:beta-galactosidase GanA